MRVFLNRPYLTRKQQYIIYLLKERGWLDFKTQDIYKDRSAFNKSIKIMNKLDLVKRTNKIIDGSIKNIVVLELQGILYYGDILSKLERMRSL